MVSPEKLRQARISELRRRLEAVAAQGLPIKFEATVARMCMVYGCKEETATGYVRILEKAELLRVDHVNDAIVWLGDRQKKEGKE